MKTARIGSFVFRYRYSTDRISQPTSPSALPLHRLLTPAFPLPLRSSVKQWLGRKKLKEAEEGLLECVGLKPGSSQSPYQVNSIDVPVDTLPGSVKGTPQLYMNELEIVNSALTGRDSENHTVLVHGYGASKGYFYQNLKPLAENSTLHALDWLGYGLSSRPVPKLPRFNNLRDGVLYAENWFLTAFESWRARRGIKKFKIVAHSLGASLASAYARRHPESVEKIVLVSPASVNRTSHSISTEQLYFDSPTKPSPAPISGSSLSVPPWFKWLWEKHWSPFSLVRRAGPYGPKVTSAWTSRRFARLPQSHQEALQIYSYCMFNAHGSGEYLLNYFLAAGGVGRWPLVERLEGIKCPTLWLYGSHDWMDVNGGVESVKRLKGMGQTALLHTIENSGHHLYLDNIGEFNKVVSEFLK